MNGSRVRLAWILLIGSFGICLGISVSVPLLARQFIQSSTRTLSVEVQANQGTVGLILGESETGALFAGEPAQSLNSNGSILTNATDQALLLVSSPDGERLLARAQIYGSTSLEVEEATAPRFASSRAQNKLKLVVNGGRLLLTIPEQDGKPVEVEIQFPQGTLQILEAGQYSLFSSNSETQVAVLEGEAEIGTEQEKVTLNDDQRAIIPTLSEIIGPTDAERNLIKNGDFGSGFEDWVGLNPNIEFPDQPQVELKINDEEGEPTLNFRRLGIGHADSGVRQIVDQDVTDFDELRLAISMRINEQSLGVCGEQGSECPLIVRIDYEDANGVGQSWLQGFYSQGLPAPTTPDVCIACPPPLNEHYRLPYGQLAFYESENLLDKLSQLGILPRRIKSITLIASGHTFDTDVVDVALLAKE